MFICSNCSKEYKSKGGLTKHINSNICGIKTIDTDIDTTKKDIDIDTTKKEIDIDTQKKDIDIDIKKQEPKKKIEIKLKKEITRKEPLNKIIYELTPELILDSKDKHLAKTTILRVIDKMHNLLYGAENIQGEDALNDIMNLIFLKILQPYYSDKQEDGKIDFFNKEYYKFLLLENESIDCDDFFEMFKNFKYLADKDYYLRKEKDSDLIDTDVICIMGKFLMTHPITKNIFKQENFLNSNSSRITKELILIVENEIKIEDLNNNEDIIGSIYEYFINGYINKKGSKLGQFFTPRILMKLILNYKDDYFNGLISDYVKINKSNNIKIFDPCKGTSGFLVSQYNLLKNKNSDINFILSGYELDQKTYQYGLMNLILSSNKMPMDSFRESSLTHINNIKHNFIITNPPFKTEKKNDILESNFKANKYTTVTNGINFEDVYILKHGNPCVQFMELNLFKLEYLGVCVIILPYGELFFGKNYKNVRKYFVSCTNITDIIIFEGGIFSHTDIKTCALIFIKDPTGTKEINFLQANKECNNLSLIQTLSIDEIYKNNNYSWFIQNYINDNIFDNSKTYVKLGDILYLEKGKLQSSKIIEDENGEAVLINWSLYDDYKKIKDYNLDGANLFISSNMPNGNKTGYLVLKYYEGKCDYINLMSRIVIKDDYKDKINLKFLYYFLKSKKTYIEEKCQKGSCNKSLYIEEFNEIIMPLIDVKIQKKLSDNIYYIDNYINYLLEDNKKLLYIIKTNLKMKIQIYFINNDLKYTKLSDICIFIKGPKQKSSLGLLEGLYPLFYCSILGNLYLNSYDYDDEALFINKTNGSGKSMIYYYNGKYNVGDSTLHFKSNNINFLTKYIYYYLFSNLQILEKEYKGSNQKSITNEDLFNIEIPNVSIEFQTALIKFYEINNLKIQNNYDYINYYKKEIDNYLEVVL